MNQYRELVLRILRKNTYLSNLGDTILPNGLGLHSQRLFFFFKGEANQMMENVNLLLRIYFCISVN